jgi:hypothetical protein
MSKQTVILSAELVSYKQFHPCICLDTDKVLNTDKVVCYYVSQVRFHIRHWRIHNDVQTTDMFSTHRTMYNCSYTTGRKFHILGVTLLPMPWLKIGCTHSFINCLSYVESCDLRVITQINYILLTFTTERWLKLRTVLN